MCLVQVASTLTLEISIKTLYLFTYLGTEGWYDIRIIDEETEIKADTLVAVLAKLEMEYKIVFEIMATSLPTSINNILHFTEGENGYSYGTRIPLVGFSRIMVGHLYFKLAVNGVTGYGYPVESTQAYKKGEWIHVEISQIEEPLGYNLTITINGRQEHTIMNNQTQTFYNVKCYASDPWKEAVQGFIRKLYVSFKY